MQVVLVVLSSIHHFHQSTMMNLKLSIFITLALFALTAMSQQDRKRAQTRPDVGVCMERCKGDRNVMRCVDLCMKGAR